MKSWNSAGPARERWKTCTRGRKKRQGASKKKRDETTLDKLARKDRKVITKEAGKRKETLLIEEREKDGH